LRVRDGRTTRSRTGDGWDFLWGFGLGFLIGPLVLFWSFAEKVTSRQKLGVLVGISVRTMISSVRVSEEIDLGGDDAYDGEGDVDVVAVTAGAAGA